MNEQACVMLHGTHGTCRARSMAHEMRYMDHKTCSMLHGTCSVAHTQKKHSVSGGGLRVGVGKTPGFLMFDPHRIFENNTNSEQK